MVSQPENQIDADGVQEDVSETSPSEATELDSLIKEYEGATSTPDTITVDSKPAVIPPTEPTHDPGIGKLAKAIQPVVDYVNQEKTQKQQGRFAAEVKDVLDFFSEADELKELPDKLKRGVLEAHAQEDSEFKAAFDNRVKAPKAWETARESARDAFTELASKLPNSKVRSDVEAAHAAVDGTTEDKPASEEGPSPEEKMRMSDFEWRKHTEHEQRLAEAS